jgi:DNA-binding transcriptional LysR family regulator
VEWSDLRIFLAIAREGTLSAAARRLGHTQPTIGRRLRALETALGHTLFQRSVDGFVLTDEGAAVLGHAERMEEEALAFQR